jgi:hypothetical protein
VADLLEARGLHRIPGRTNFLCITPNFHLMCTLKKLFFLCYGTGRHPGQAFSSSAAAYTLAKEKGEYKTVAITVARSSELNKMYQRGAACTRVFVSKRRNTYHLINF